jgi:signal transduction histidine kinase/HPt (histidine-containing phosphotransfer) domain-containing protein/ActR/RegA family two-component response regulator
MGGLLLQVAGAIALTVVAAAVAHWLRAERRARLWLEQRVAERTSDLAEANRRLTSANRAKTDFLANMSHEIRTPLSAILGFADVLGDDRLDRRERREAVQVIRRNSEHLLAILSNILDIAKIEAGKLTVEEIACSPREIAEEVCALLRHRAEAKGIRLLLRIESPAIPRRMRSDPTRLRQILVNLVGNAIKFTERGMVTLAVGLDLPGPGRGEHPALPGLRFEVRDSGIGMGPAELERAFAEFEQADATITRRYGGSGLGLPICRRLTAALGGELTAQSTRGEGSTFKLVLPLREVDQVVEDLNETAIVAPRGIPPRRGLRVLVADDASDIQLLIARFLADIDAQVTTAGSGRHAVDAVLAAQAEARPFDLILMDLHMPELDGAAAVKTLRAGGVETPIVALTGSAYVEDRDRCIRAGYSGLLLKPVDRGELIQHVATLTGVDPRVLGPRPAVSEPPSQPTGEVAPPKSAAPAWDGARLLAMVGGDESARRAVMSLFQSDAPSLVQAIQGAASNGDTAAVRAGAHKIRGMLLNVCAAHAAGVAAELESLARSGESQRFQSLAGRLQTEVNRVCGSMSGG